MYGVEYQANVINQFINGASSWRSELPAGGAPLCFPAAACLYFFIGPEAARQNHSLASPRWREPVLLCLVLYGGGHSPAPAWFSLTVTVFFVGAVA